MATSTGSGIANSGFHNVVIIIIKKLSIYAIIVPYVFIHPSVGGHLGCFQVLVIMNIATMKIVQQVLCSHMEYPLGYTLSSGIAGS